MPADANVSSYVTTLLALALDGVRGNIEHRQLRSRDAASARRGLSVQLRHLDYY